MVKLQVLVKMELEGVTDVKPADDDFQYMFTILCTSCREEHPNTVTISLNDEAEISGSKGTANFVWRCGNCKREHSASFIPPLITPKSKNSSTAPLAYTGESPSSDGFSPLVAIDCRGLEIAKYHFTGRWTCVGAESGSKFEYDLDEIAQEGGGDENRWDDYDEKAEAAVGVSEMESRIARM